jgi:hypothetical protein
MVFKALCCVLTLVIIGALIGAWLQKARGRR